MGRLRKRSEFPFGNVLADEVLRGWRTVQAAGHTDSPLPLAEEGQPASSSIHLPYRTPTPWQNTVSPAHPTRVSRTVKLACAGYWLIRSGAIPTPDSPAVCPWRSPDPDLHVRCLDNPLRLVGGTVIDLSPDALPVPLEAELRGALVGAAVRMPPRSHGKHRPSKTLADLRSDFLHVSVEVQQQIYDMVVAAISGRRYTGSRWQGCSQSSS